VAGLEQSDPGSVTSERYLGYFRDLVDLRPGPDGVLVPGEVLESSSGRRPEMVTEMALPVRAGARPCATASLAHSRLDQQPKDTQELDSSARRQPR